jgi:hypothetical protein
MSMTRGLRSFVVLALLLLASAASGHGVGASPAHPPGRPPTIVVNAPDGGFHWTDAGVGAAAMLATTLLTLGLLLALRSDHRGNGKP